MSHSWVDVTYENLTMSEPWFTFSCIMLVVGAKLFERVSVERVKTRRGHVIGVQTDKGFIECKYFVNAAGQVQTYSHFFD